ncbi:uncharacterized protein RHOBADRAFT_50465, partial [Rhodotorula graminis WP1]
RRLSTTHDSHTQHHHVDLLLGPAARRRQVQNAEGPGRGQPRRRRQPERGLLPRPAQQPRPLEGRRPGPLRRPRRQPEHSAHRRAADRGGAQARSGARRQAQQVSVTSSSPPRRTLVALYRPPRTLDAVPATQ